MYSKTDSKKTQSLVPIYNRIKIYIPAALGIIGLFILGQILSPGFASISNIATVIASAGVLTFASTGQGFIIMSGKSGIDMSLGAIMSFGAVIVPMISEGSNDKLWLALIVVVSCGFLFGLINGIGVHLLKIPALAMTLVMGFVIDGSVLAITQGKAILTCPPLLKSIGRPVVGEFRWIMLVALAFIVIIQLVLTKTKYGKSLLLVGSNRDSAKLCGINVDIIVLAAYALGGAFACFGGMLLLGYVGNAQMQMASSYTMLSVAAAVIGGVKLSGGCGNAIGIALGSIVMVALSGVLVATGLSIGMQILFEGLILLLIVLLNNRGKKYRV